MSRSDLRSGIEPGITRVGPVVHPSDALDEVVSVTFDDEGAVVTWPHLEPFRATETTTRRRPPRAMQLKDPLGSVVLRDGERIGIAAPGAGVSQDRIRYRIAIEAGDRILDFGSLIGMTTEIAGLAQWAGMSAVTQRLDPDESGAVRAVELRAENLEPVHLGGALDISLETSFDHSPDPDGNVYSLADILTVRTRSDSALSWTDHAASHRMLQDLMCLVYGRPCDTRLKFVMHQQEPEIWRPAYEPAFGRRRPLRDQLGQGARPLFCLADTDADRVADWLTDYELWSRPTWIAVTTLFQRDSTPEAQLLQIGVALEALGYAIHTAAPEGGKPKLFVDMVQRIVDRVPYHHDSIYGQVDASQWVYDFNAAYKGIKHADNPLVDSAVATERAAQGLNLIRCWLGAELGVTPETMYDALDDPASNGWRL